MYKKLIWFHDDFMKSTGHMIKNGGEKTVVHRTYLRDISLIYENKNMLLIILAHYWSPFELKASKAERQIEAAQ